MYKGNTTDFYIDTANNHINPALLLTATILSTVGASITIGTYIFIKDIKTMSRHIIVCISIGDLLTCISNFSGILIPPTHKTKSLCEVQSFFSTTAVLTSFLWTLMLTVYLYTVIVRERIDLAKRIIIPWSHMFCWSIPIAINVIALTTGNLGNDGDETSAGWCWIRILDDSMINF